MSQAKNNRFLPLGLSVLSGVLLWLAWPVLPTAFLIFFALIPLLALEDVLLKTSKNPAFKLVLFSYLTFLTWNILTTYWIWFASPAGAAMAIILNSLLMTFPVYFAHRVRRYAGRSAGYAALVCFWLLFEFIHFNWDAPWPWLSLGNAFAMFPDWIQWYEFTGVLGGTLWIWILNMFVYSAFLKKYFSPNAYMDVPGNASINTRNALAAVALIVVPIAISYAVKPLEPALDPEKNIVVVQPNIDPYEVKFDQSTYAAQINTLISLSEQKIDDKTVAVIWPETAIAENIQTDQLMNYPVISTLQTFLKKHPKLKLITGTNSYTIYDKASTPTARQFKTDHSKYFDVFNTALLLDSTQNFKTYYKSKLVPGVEKMPYPSLFSFLETLIIDLGGTSGSLGSQDSAAVFNVDNEVVAAPIICYESIFGDYVNDFVEKGATVITIITNDGWWRDSPGYKQHLNYGVLRAIETRRFIARSANTGTSCYILPTGKILQATKFWEPAVLKSDIYINHEKTFYTLYGDYIGVLAKYVAFVFLIIAFFGKYLRKYFPGSLQERA